MKKYESGIIYFFGHLAIDFISLFIVTKYLNVGEEYIGIVVILYDLLAFVPQGLIGSFLDEKMKIPAMLIGGILTCLAIVFFGINLTPWLVIPLIGLGNMLVHISGAERTIRTSPGKLTNAAIYVSGGAFGFAVCKALLATKMQWYCLFGFLLILILLIIYEFKNKIDYDDTTNLEKYEYHNVKIKPVFVILLATFVVAIRAFIGYGIPTSWQTELWQTVLLFVMMGVGKILGGILVDKIGIKWTALISTIGSIPFLLTGDKIMVLSIIGVALFSMTMAVSLAIIVSADKKRPGVAFGWTTIGLFVGTFPMFFFKFDSYLTAAIVISVFSVVCAIILFFIAPPFKNNKNISNVDRK